MATSNSYHSHLSTNHKSTFMASPEKENVTDLSQRSTASKHRFGDSAYKWQARPKQPSPYVDDNSAAAPERSLDGVQIGKVRKNLSQQF
mmetsp:Transcript_15127/g.20526  ORF Transcript_15127/g.20526 Transcript_15127/m.20526 type:complete len:89 (-) Transcript_15127:25-291(-)